MTEIATLPGFAFLLLIICIGYVFIETLSPGFPNLLEHLHRHNDGMLERGLLYIIAGVIINYSFVLVSSLTQTLDNIANMLNSSGALASNFSIGTTGAFNIQMFTFSVFYFILMLVISWMFAWGIRILFGKKNKITNKSIFK